MTVHTVNTEAGRLSGDHTDGVARFLGIPYAAAPAGERRFAPPGPAERWAGTRNATGYGATAPQPALHPAHAYLAPLIGPGWVTGDGDYLNLNVWTPDPGTSGLPVMVYVHGGGFMIGSGAAPAFDGASFARDGVVLVTVNYRLGAEGFLALSGEITNIGLRDQIAALHWVRDNIAGFGGNPDNVTVFGESAGGSSVAFLLRSPLAAGLFQRAIVQSGHDEMARRSSSPKNSRRHSPPGSEPPRQQAHSEHSLPPTCCARRQLCSEANPAQTCAMTTVSTRDTVVHCSFPPRVTRSSRTRSESRAHTRAASTC